MSKVKSTDACFSFDEAMDLLKVGAHGFVFENCKNDRFFVALDSNTRPVLKLVVDDAIKAENVTPIGNGPKSVN